MCGTDYFHGNEKNNNRFYSIISEKESPLTGRQHISDPPIAQQRILHLAGEWFTLEGFHRVSIDDIAGELGISKKTFYKFFSGKEELVSRILDSLLGELHRKITAVQSSDLDFIGKFQQVMELIGQTTNRLSRPFLRDLQQKLPQLWNRIEAFRRERVLTNFSALIEQGIREKHIRSSVHKTVFLQAYLASVESIITPLFLMNESLSARDAVRVILEIFFQGALTPAAAKKLARLQQRQQIHREGIDQ